MATQNFEKEVVEVAKKVLLCALGQLERAQALVDQAQEKYWSAVNKYRFVCNPAHNEYQSVEAPDADRRVWDIQQCNSRPSVEQSTDPMEPASPVQCADVTPPATREESDERQEWDREACPPRPPSPPSPRAHVLAVQLEESDERQEWDREACPPCPPSPSSPRAHVLAVQREESDERQEWDREACPPCPSGLPSPRAHTMANDLAAKDKKKELHSPTNLETPELTEEPNTISTKIEQLGHKRTKECVLQLTRLEEEPKKKKSKVEKRFVLVNNQQRIFISMDVLVSWITLFWKSPASRGIEFNRPSRESLKIKSASKKSNDKKKKSIKKMETEEERTKRRERDRIRKREQRQKQKEDQKIKKARVPLIRSDVIAKQHSTTLQTPLFTSCTECRNDCWYKGDGFHNLPWLLCVVCQTNWANGSCSSRIPYECRICRLKRT